MSVKRKTVRFQDTPGDIAAYDAINNYKSYGFRSESHMVITAISNYLSQKEPSLSPEEFADLIATRLSGLLTVSSQTLTPADTKPTEEEVFNTALDFINTI